ncbi:MAG: serine/threonine-protein kinase [Phycisphaerae bacterium]
MSNAKVGDRINNFLLEAPVGRGSFGQVWRARHHMLDQVVAIKIPTDAQYVRNLQSEGVAIHGLKHPNIVRALDLDPYSDPPYLIMEYVDGPSLRQVIDANRQGLPLSAVLTIMGGLLSALEASHTAGLIHRDVKPANILIRCPLERIADIGPEAVKVTDFGLGRAGDVTTASLMQSGSLLTEGGQDISGTIAYMSPEQKEGRSVDGRSDLYSCGIVLFEMLIGERPAGTEMPGSLRSDIPSFVDDVFRRSYTRVERRFRSAAEMAQALKPPRLAPGPPPIPGRSGLQTQCTRCGQRADADDQFCIHCGHQMVAMVPRCAACQAFVNRDDRYCIFCGAKLAAAAG